MPTKKRATATRPRMLTEPDHRRRVLAALATDQHAESPTTHPQGPSDTAEPGRPDNPGDQQTPDPDSRDEG